MTVVHPINSSRRRRARSDAAVADTSARYSEPPRPATPAGGRALPATWPARRPSMCASGGPRV